MMSVERAKEMFLNYDGNLFQMYRDGVSEYKLYKSYGISVETEKLWLRDRQNEIFNKFFMTQNIKEKVELFWKYGVVTYENGYTKDYWKLVEYIIANSHNWDSWSMLGVAENIFDNRRNTGKKRKAKKIAIKLLKNTLKRPIFVGDDYKIDGELPWYISSEQELLERIKGAIKYWRWNLK